MIEFRAAAAMGRRVRGHALVAKDGFSARYDLDRVNGVFSRPEHKLAGQSYVGRILVLDVAKKFAHRNAPSDDRQIGRQAALAAKMAEDGKIVTDDR